MTRNCLNVLRKTASVSKKADLSTFWNKAWKRVGNVVKNGADKLAAVYAPNGLDTRTDVTAEDVARYLQRNFDRGGKWATPEGLNSAARMYARSRGGAKSLNQNRAHRQRVLDLISKHPNVKINDRSGKDYLRQMDDQDIIRGLHAFIANGERWSPPSKAERVLDVVTDTVNNDRDLLFN